MTAAPGEERGAVSCAVSEPGSAGGEAGEPPLESPALFSRKGFHEIKNREDTLAIVAIRTCRGEIVV